MEQKSIESVSQVKIVQATSEDAKGIQELMGQSVMATYVRDDATDDDVKDYYREEQSPEGLEKLTRDLLEPKAGVMNFVAKDKGQVVGYCQVSKANPDNPKQNVLARIHVLPSRKGERIGKSLWDKAQTALDPHKDTVLWVVENNTPSIDVYEQHWNFSKTGNRKEKKMKSGASRNEIEMLRKARE